ncbi:hypothetical protein M407DRAFT_233130 [Tulasnella calospora MUT 4182]|uniref:SH3 domain-containing protein n=1 Tax=Tulasnella calospora MUT 4182 TaxID=1051891 RepID=A0A0C3QLA6_9AGAM|nr:hypothetical protein M407DRAFT_233130 [Tulasnella calospora MUT 4182]
MNAKLEAEEKKRAEAEAKERLRKENEEKRAREKVEEVERIIMTEEEKQRKREKEERREAEEERARKEREEAKAKAKAIAEEEQRLRRLAEEANARFATKNQEKGLSGGSTFPSAQRSPLTSNLPRKWASIWRIVDLNRVAYPEGIRCPSVELDNGRIMPGGKHKPSGRGGRRRMGLQSGPFPALSPPKSTGLGLTGFPGRLSATSSLVDERNFRSETTSEERFKASWRKLEQGATSQAANSGLQPSLPPTLHQGHDSSIARGIPKDKELASNDLAEEGQKNSERTAAEVANHQALNAISELSKQMVTLLQEMKELKGEVRELRTAAKSGDRREPSKSPQCENSVQKVSRTATAINQYFIMKQGELDFGPGDVITILDAPQDTPRGWMYGDINVTKRGLFPASYVKLRE